jgi:hypothetical protein
LEDTHEVFLGYETGAIAIFEVRMSRNDEKPLHVEIRVLISSQRFSSDQSIKHVLAIQPVDLGQKLKLVIGFFA